MQNPDTYQPSSSVLKALQTVNLVTVVGPSGSGKTTLIKLAMQADSSLHVVISDVSRAPRPGEQNGVDYFFRSKTDMLAAIDRHEYVQAQQSNSGDIYASHIDNYASTGTTIIPVWADAVPALRALPFKRLRTIFIVPASYEAWQSHLGLHEFTPELRTKRLAEARRSFEFALSDHDVELLINDDLKQATIDFLAIVHRPAGAPVPDQIHAHAVAQTILDRLSEDAA